MSKVKGVLLVLCIFLAALGGPAAAADAVSVTYSALPTVVEGVGGQIYDIDLVIIKNSGEFNSAELKVEAYGGFLPSGTDTYNINFEEGSNDEVTVSVEYDGSARPRLRVKVAYGIEEVVSTIAIRSVPLDEEEDEAEEAELPPTLVVENADMPEFAAGSSGELKFSLLNNGDKEAKDIYITPEYPDGNIFIPEKIVASTYLPAVKSGRSVPVTFRFAVSPTAAEKIYPVKLNIKYTDRGGDSFVTSETIFVRVVNSQLIPVLGVAQVTCQPEKIAGGSAAQVTVWVENTGTLSAKEIRVSLAGFAKEGLFLTGGTNTRYLNSLGGDAKTSVTFDISAAEEIASGSNQLTAKLEYKDEAGGSYTEEQHFFLPVEGRKGVGAKTVPKIIIGEYSASPAIVRAGQNFNLSVSFLNTNSVKAVQNIKIFLTVDEETQESGSVFTPVDSSNTFFIDYIAPKGTYEKQLTFFTVPDAPPKNYTLTANIEYEDEDGNPYTATELIGVPVVQQTRLETSDLSVPMQAFSGQPFPVFLEFYNMGKTTLYNLMVKLEGNFQTQDGNYFVGNFEPGRSDYYNGTVIPTETGTASGAVVFAYDDAAGEHNEVRKEFTLSVEEMMMEPGPEFGPDGRPIKGEMPPGMEQGNTMSSRLAGAVRSPVVWIAALGIAGAAVVLIRRRLAQKKGIELDE
ncbi:MAG: COG1361 S-layer family protein [bacterium]|jgi:hypothetical protein